MSGTTSMNSKKRIRTDWASLVVADDGDIIVACQTNGNIRYLHFETAAQFKEAIEAKTLSVQYPINERGIHK